MLKLTKMVCENLTFNSCIATAENKGIEYCPFLAALFWPFICELPCVFTQDLKPQNLQYSIIHRYAVFKF